MAYIPRRAHKQWWKRVCCNCSELFSVVPGFARKSFRAFGGGWAHRNLSGCWGILSLPGFYSDQCSQSDQTLTHCPAWAHWALLQPWSHYSNFVCETARDGSYFYFTRTKTCLKGLIRGCQQIWRHWVQPVYEMSAGQIGCQTSQNFRICSEFWPIVGLGL